MGKQSAKKIWEEEKAKKGVVGSNQNMLQNETQQSNLLYSTVKLRVINFQSENFTTYCHVHYYLTIDL